MGGKGKGGGLAQPSYRPQSGMGGKGKGGAQAGTQPTQSPYVPPTQPQVQPPTPPQQYYTPQYRPQTYQNPYAQGGFGGKGGQMQPYQQAPSWAQQGGMGGKGGQIQQFINQQPQPQGGYGMKGGHRGWEGRHQRPDTMQQETQSQTGLAALQQPTATTQALTPAPASDQPYMGNYLQ